MNKITGISESKQVLAKNNVQKTDSDLFKKTLENAIESKNISKTQGLTSSTTLGEIHTAPVHSIDDQDLSLEHKTEKLLDQLDDYVKKLGDSGKTLREIEPVVNSIKDSADALMARADKDGIQDKNLRKLVEDSAMMANIEFIKFNRGDYI